MIHAWILSSMFYFQVCSILGAVLEQNKIWGITLYQGILLHWNLSLICGSIFAITITITKLCQFLTHSTLGAWFNTKCWRFRIHKLPSRVWNPTFGTGAQKKQPSNTSTNITCLSIQISSLINQNTSTNIIILWAQHTCNDVSCHGSANNRSLPYKEASPCSPQCRSLKGRQETSLWIRRPTHSPPGPPPCFLWNSWLSSQG